VVATLAAWQQGNEWQETLLQVLNRNRYRLRDALANTVPAARHHMPEATYLSWIDVSALGIEDPVDHILSSGRVLVDGGTPFGHSGRKFIRINFATAAPILDQVLSGITGALTDPPIERVNNS
jgi:cystathionine beta-lyase